MTKATIPPVPPAARSNKGPGASLHGKRRSGTARSGNRRDDNPEQGQQGNIAQNTRNQGYQQDR
jgi:hypothetical protein